MRVAHITDVHVLVPPRPRELLSKRLIGSANLYLLGRRAHFTAEVQAALVRDVAAQAPDGLICTGDLSAQATERELEAARTLLEPLLSAQPSALIPGNHDTYTRRAYRERRLERYFGPWMGAGPWPRIATLGPGVAAVMLSDCRAGWDSSGRIDGPQLSRLEAVLEDARLDDHFVFLMLHYPLRDRRGAPYGPPARSLRGARELEAALARHADRLGAIVHGHEHHGFRSALPEALGGLPILNPGSGGYAWLPERGRRAHFNVYTVEGGALIEVERFAYSGTSGAFEPEPGGAYASGG